MDFIYNYEELETPKERPIQHGSFFCYSKKTVNNDEYETWEMELGAELKNIASLSEISLDEAFNETLEEAIEEMTGRTLDGMMSSGNWNYEKMNNGELGRTFMTSLSMMIESLKTTGKIKGNW
jgi:hypothetical protein